MYSLDHRYFFITFIRKKTMNRQRTLTSSIILASLLGVFAVPVLAAHPDCGARGAEHRAEHMAQNHQKLHDTLKLNPGQDMAWNKMIAAELPLLRSNQTNRDDWAKLTTPERGEKRLQHLKAEQALLADHVAALNDFYAVLMPEQKIMFDEFHEGPRHGVRGQRELHAPLADKPAAKL